MTEPCCSLCSVQSSLSMLLLRRSRGMPQETLKFVLLRLNLEAVLIKNCEAVAKCSAGHLYCN